MRFLLLDLPQSNVASVHYWLLRNGHQVEFYSKVSSDFSPFDALLIPGVGSFDIAYRFLQEHGGIKTINAFFQEGKLVIGICLGMQLMCLSSEEGSERGLGLVNGDVRLLKRGMMQVPNIGWRTVSTHLGGHQSLFSSINNQKFYFMHSYALPYAEYSRLDASSLLLSESNSQFIAAFAVNNLIGLQFHPEKSYKAGDELLSQIVGYYA